MLTDKDFIVFVGSGGGFGDDDAYTSKEQVDKLVDGIVNSGKSSVSLHFHGGLVGRKDGLVSARGFAAYMEKTDSYPVCFIWETDMLTILKEKLLIINESPFFKKMLLKALKKFAERYVPAVDSRGGKSKISDQWIGEEMSKGVPFSNWNEGINTGNSRGLVSDSEFHRGEPAVTQEIKLELEDELAFDTELAELVEAYNNSDSPVIGSRGIISLSSAIMGIAKIVWRVIKRFYNERDHGFYLTVVEEVLREFYIGDIGSEIWDSMKSKATDMWDKSEDSENVAAYFMHSLTKKLNGTSNLKVNLVGHSAGSIAVLHGYKSFFNHSHSHLIKEIIFIAPACRFDLFNEVMGAASPLKGRWSIFALSDEREKSDVMIPVLYPQSLLYFVSSLLEGEGDDVFILGMERFWKNQSGFENDPIIKGVKDLFSSQSHGFAFAAALGEIQGRRTDGYHHGQIDDDLTTQESIQFLISN